MTGSALDEARATLVELGRGERPAGAVRLRFEQVGEGQVARIELDHPEARSAMSLSMMVDLADAVLALREWEGGVVILGSTDPRAFCAGGHLGQVTRAVADPEGAERMCRAMTTVLDTLRDLPQISVSAVQGLAVGGGAELATATDFRVSGPEARIHFVHARLGIVPGWGGTARLVRIVGRRLALEILARARPLGPGEAARIGLVDHRCDGSAAVGAERWLADTIAAPPEVVRALKAQVVSAVGEVPAPGAEAFASVWGGPAHRRALEALERHRR